MCRFSPSNPQTRARTHAHTHTHWGTCQHSKRSLETMMDQIIGQARAQGRRAGFSTADSSWSTKLSQNETFSWELLSLQYLTEQVSRIDMALQTNTAALRSFRGINDNKTNSSLGADKIHLLYGQRCFCSNCLLLSPNVCFSFSRSVLSGVMALTEAASASKERGQGEWVPPVCPHRLQSPNHILPAN